MGSQVQRIGDAYSLVRKHYEPLACLYSAGQDIDSVAEAARRTILDIYTQFISVCLETPNSFKGEYSGGWDDRYKYLSFAILLNLSKAECQPLIDSLEFWEEPDGGMDKMMSLLGYPRNRTQSDQTEVLLWPEAYQPLMSAMSPETSEPERTQYVTQFVKNWLKEIRKSTHSAYNNHKSQHDIYFGYWWKPPPSRLCSIWMIGRFVVTNTIPKTSPIGLKRLSKVKSRKACHRKVIFGAPYLGTSYQRCPRR